MGGAACAAKILLCSPPVAQRATAAMEKAVAVANLAMSDYGGNITSEHLSELQQAVCRCEALAEEIEKTCAGPLRACMDDVYVCAVTK